MKSKIAMLTMLLALFATHGHSVPLLNIVTDTMSSEQILPLGGPHDVSVTAGATGWYDADLWVASDLGGASGVILTFEFLGYEAGWVNKFLVGDDLVFQNKNPSVTSSYNIFASAGSLIDFSFETLQKNTHLKTVDNGSNVAPVGLPSGIENYGLPNFFLGYADDAKKSVYIALDDGGGHWDGSIIDDNHDDLVLKVTASPVPEPATMILFGAGLAGLAGLRRKRN